MKTVRAWAWLLRTAVIPAVLTMLALAAPATSARPAAMPPAVTAAEHLRFDRFISGLSFGPQPGDIAVTYGNGEASVIQDGRETLYLRQVAEKPGAVRWVPDTYWIAARRQAAPQGPFTVNGASQDIEGNPAAEMSYPVPVAPSHAGGVQVLKAALAWPYGNTLFLTGLPPADVHTYPLPTRQRALAVAVDPTGRMLAVWTATGIQAEVLATDKPVGSLLALPYVNGSRMVWSDTGLLAVAVRGEVRIWDPQDGTSASFGVLRSGTIIQMSWPPDGTGLLVLQERGSGASPRFWELDADTADGGRTVLLRGRLGYVLGVDAAHGLLWREEGVSAGLYSGSGPGAGPFALEAVPIRGLYVPSLPARYVPPRAVAPRHVVGTWTALAGIAAPDWSGFPLTVGIALPPETGGVQVAPGAPAEIEVIVSNETRSTVRIDHPVSLVFDVSQANPATTPLGRRVLLWRGILPPLGGSIPADSSVQMTFFWNQADSSGRRVPPGAYLATLRIPVPAIHVTRDGITGAESVPPMPHQGAGQSYSEPILIGSYPSNMTSLCPTVRTIPGLPGC